MTEASLQAILDKSRDEGTTLLVRISNGEILDHATFMDGVQEDDLDDRREEYFRRCEGYRLVREAALEGGHGTRALKIPSAVLLMGRDLGFKAREIAAHLGVAYGTLRQTMSSRGIRVAKYVGKAPDGGRWNDRREDALELLAHLGIPTEETDELARVLAHELSAALARYDRQQARKATR